MKDSEISWKFGLPYQALQDMKKLADTVESILGAYLVAGGEKMAAELMNTFNALYVDNNESPEDFLICPTPTEWTDQDEPDQHMIDKREYTKPSIEEMRHLQRVEQRISDSLQAKGSVFAERPETSDVTVILAKKPNLWFTAEGHVKLWSLYANVHWNCSFDIFRLADLIYFVYKFIVKTCDPFL